ncbi:hypothetical protein N7505_012093 [Penicillium chrysogenum]|uniref:TauD/TfdA-like domain-containing protein n=1 Tax=Penicillium chrysogenum TaxID=5076 RepID=A0ABQ8W0M3_PENCH|nr:hypothetical protein N7505_012093 [Penicillium chrysogenum]
MHRFRVVHTARVTTASYSTHPVRDLRTSTLVPLIEVAKPALASDASHLRDIYKTLEAKGVLQVQLGFNDENSTYLRSLISNLHKNHSHGLPITHSAERGCSALPYEFRKPPSSIRDYVSVRMAYRLQLRGATSTILYSSSPPAGSLRRGNVFTKTARTQYIIGNLLAVNPRESSGSQLRFREDITVPLTLDASKALDELKEILYSAAQEESLHLPPQSLPQGSIIMIDNRRWLHSRNEVKDPNRHLRRLSNCSSSWPAESLDASCPYPVLTTQRHDNDMRNLHLALKSAIEDIIKRWWTDREARFPLRMPLESEEEDLLRWLDSNRDLLPLWNERQGSWRPDFLVEKDDAGIEVFRICEINARFCWNGYMHAGFGQDSLSAFNLGSRGLVHTVEGETILGGLLDLFDSKIPLHLVKSEEHGIDIAMFIEFAQKRLGIKPRLITPDTLRLIPDASQSGKEGYKLCCLAEGDAIGTITTESGEIVEEIHQISLELHQREINALDPEMRRQISLRCFNDMRTILLAHDKRMLGLVLEELNDLVCRNVITSKQAEWLRRGLAHTILPGSTASDGFIEDCKASDVFQNDYLLKPIRGGKGAGILFGDEVDHSQWLALLEPMRCPRLRPGKTLYVVQRKVHQPYYDVPLGSKAKLERCHMVGTYHAVNGHYLGLGVWRCSPGRLCAVSNGATWICSVKEGS